MSGRRRGRAALPPLRSAHWPLWRAAGGARAGRMMRPRNLRRPVLLSRYGSIVAGTTIALSAIPAVGTGNWGGCGGPRRFANGAARFLRSSSLQVQPETQRLVIGGRQDAREASAAFRTASAGNARWWRQPGGLTPHSRMKYSGTSIENAATAVRKMSVVMSPRSEFHDQLTFN